MYNTASSVAWLPEKEAPAVPKHILSSADLSGNEIRLILDAAKILKEERKARIPVYANQGLLLSMIFEKQSLRTRVSFETAFRELGGHAIYLTKADIDPGKRESVADIAQTLSTWSTLMVARMNSHANLCELASHSNVPVINALTDSEHPCQALADLMTVEEHFGTSKMKLAWIGDGNNVANSFAITASLLGHDVVVCTPPGYEASNEALSYPNVTSIYNPFEAAENADVIYTDVWVSMGQEEESAVREKRFAKYQINAELMSLAKQEAVFLHCLPAKRGYEVSDEVIDGPQSAVFQQAENRLHAQKALMKLLMAGVLK